jgi:mono/diheme cytochrome c family protein
MRRLILRIAAGLTLLMIAGVIFVRGRGISNQRAPLPGEARFARAAWRFMIPADARNSVNPVPDTPEVLEHALAHFADHCAICHDNDGGGDTTIGRRIFPPAPDMRGTGTQELTDGELFYAIEQGIPWTAMPGWSTGIALHRCSWCSCPGAVEILEENCASDAEFFGIRRWPISR